MASPSWLRGVVAALIVLTAVLTSGTHRGGAPALVDDTGGEEPAEEADPAEVAIGERLFLETRFAQHFFALSGGDVNAAVPSDPVVDETVTTAPPLPGPFAGLSMTCRSCHLVDEQGGVAGGGHRTYADFARRSPVPERADGERVTVRTGRADSLEAVLGLYVEFSGRARADTMRNPAPELQGMALAGGDVAALVAFLRALNEDYE
jgi:hypothetical protein